MYTKSNSKLTNKVHDITRYIDKFDLGNSLLFRELPKLPFIGHLFIKYKRYDLISQEIYGSSKYSWMLMIYSGINEKDLKVNTYMKYPSLESIQDLILRLNEYK